MLNELQIKKLLQFARSVTADDSDCDCCGEQIARFAELELAGKSIPEAMQSVKDHLENCPCCQHEFEDLLAALRCLHNR